MSFKGIENKDEAVSSVVGEMLLLVITVVLAAVFGVAAMNLLPSERDDVADICADFSGGNITLYHKGGDSLAASELKVGVYRGINQVPSKSEVYRFNSTTDSWDKPGATVFSLGGKIVVNSTKGPFASGDEVRLSSSKSIIYSGTVR